MGPVHKSVNYGKAPRLSKETAVLVIVLWRKIMEDFSLVAIILKYSLRKI